MSIKKLFDSENNRNYLTDKNVKEAFKSVESQRNVAALKEKQDSFLPQIDYSDPGKFARYGSAYLYYKSAFERVHNYYPYDGSSAEKTEFYNKSLDIEKYIFEKVYPSSTGYVTISQTGWGSQASVSGGYGIPDSQEYITFFGGPGTASSQLGPDPYSDIRQFNNIYDTSIYTTEGLLPTYGSGSRESNLKSNFDTGVTVEFWAKTGSMDGGDDTLKQVVFDMWNNEASSSQAYGRITIELTGADQGDASRTHVNGWNDSPFLLTVQSGSGIGATAGMKAEGAPGAFTASIGKNFSSSSLGSWAHYAVTLYNSGSDLRADFFVNGLINDRKTFNSQGIGALNPKNMVGRIGSLLTQPSASYAGASGGGKLNGSIDEFRFWKVRRTPEEIGRNWFVPVNGGVNTDVSNAELGMYYKFNEGITGESYIDAIVLDYGGRVCNGTWTGYSSTSRNTGSAMVSASAAAFEPLEPIIRSIHPDVVARKASLLSSGSYHDSQNNSNLASMLPAWVLEEHESQAENQKTDNNLQLMSHIMGTYFDKLFLQIEAVPKFKHAGYTSGSHKPVPFAQHLPQSLGLITPEIFIDSTIMEKFGNRNENSQFESDLNDTKNLIYSNLYNNIAGIYKAKGTEKSIRNALRCFNVDDRLIKMNTYSNNQVYTVKNNLKQVILTKKSLNFDKLENTDAVLYQKQNPENNESRGYIAGQVDGHQYRYGFTAEANVFFPTFTSEYDVITRTFKNVAIFGMQMVHTGNAGGTNAATVEAGTVPAANSMTAADTSWLLNDDVNFQVYAVRDNPTSRNVKFVLDSRHSTTRPFPKLESDTFLDVYDNSSWNLSVRLKPSNYPYSHMVSGSGTYTFDLIFQGYNTELGAVKNTFAVTESISQVSGSNFIKAGKRLSTGAYRINLTGATEASFRPAGTPLSTPMKSDINVSSVKVWSKYVDDNALLQHSADINNLGITGSYQNISPKDANSDQVDILNTNTLALAWNFDNVSTSDAAGNFYTIDVSSGSANIRNNRGWLGAMAGYQHTGYGYGFITSSTEVVDVREVNAFVTQDPELVQASDMVQIVDDTDYYFGTPQDVPSFYYTFEKSMYAAISEEMLHFFAGILDFNNLIGHPVNRYRGNYKELDNLRNIFFEKVSNVTEVERYIEYYKWFDDAIITVIEQLMPASSDTRPDVTDTIESHVLERNKYKTKYPTLNILSQPLEAVLLGLGEKMTDYRLISTPLPSSPRKAHKKEGVDIYPVRYWKERAERSSEELTSGDPILDDIRDKIKTIVATRAHKSSSIPTFRTLAGASYKAPTFAMKSLSMPFNVTVDNPLGTGSYLYKGGTNFREKKNIHFTYDALHPAGPINQDNGAFVPKNVLLAHASEIVELPEYFKATLNKRKKVKRYFKVHHGRNWEDGFGYMNTKSSYAFPFNIISSSVSGGFNDEIKAYFTGGLELTNLHHDTYGDDQEVPLQGPFTNYAVGGHQSRHISLNTGSDNWLSRPEAWKILVGRCVNGIRQTGSLGMVGPDFPYPEAKDDRTSVTRIARAGLTNNKGIVWPDPAGGDNRGNCLVIPSTGSDSNNASWALLFDNNMTGSANEFPTWTFSGWINPSASNADRNIWAAGCCGGSGDEIHTISIEGDEALRYRVRTSDNAGSGAERSTWWETPASALTNGSWNHIAVSVTGTIGSLTTTIKPTLYINGVSQSWNGSTSPSSTPKQHLPSARSTENNFRGHADLDLAGPIILGGTIDSANSHEYGGNMDEVSVWNTQLTNDEVYAIYNGGVPTNLSHSSTPQYEYLAAWWRMGEGTSATVDAVNTGAASSAVISANNIVRDLISTASLLPVASSGYDIEMSIGFSSLTGTIEISDVIKVGPMPYPVSASQKAVYYRDYIAKRPVNFKNIQLKPGSPTISSLGNYTKNYEVVQSHGAFINNRRFVDEQPLIPSASRRYGMNYTDIVNFIHNIHRGEAAHFDYDIDYKPNQFTGSENKSIFISRFSAPGGPETLARGFQDLRGAEYSVYNTVNYRNLTVIRPGQAPSGTLSIGVGEQGFGATTQVAAQGVPGMRVYDIHTRDYGLTSHYARHTAKFGRDSLLQTGTLADPGIAQALQAPGASYNQLPGFHKTHRNNIRRLKLSGSTIISSSQFDNFFVQHAIPRSDTQYSWISASLLSDNDIYGHPPANFMVSQSLGRFDGYDEAYTFITASDTVSYNSSGLRFFGRSKTNPLIAPGGRDQLVPVDFTGLNINIREPVSASTNTLGYASLDVDFTATAASGYVNYVNHKYVYRALSTQGGKISSHGQGVASMLNSIILHRDGPYGYPTWKANRRQNHPVLREERKRGEISMITSGNQNLRHYELRPVSTRGRPMLINLSPYNNDRGVIKTTGVPFTLKATHDNELIGFNDVELNDQVLYGSVRPTTPYDQITRIVGVNGNNYLLNWVVYTQNIFPSSRNEYSASVRERLNYDNFFWRDQQDQRIALTKPLHWYYGGAAPVNPPWTHTPRNVANNISFDVWPLSAPQSFLTRSHVAPLPHLHNGETGAKNPNFTGKGSAFFKGNLSGTAAGILQNSFSSYITGASEYLSEYTGYTSISHKYKNYYAIRALMPVPLYSRKHAVAAPWSVVAPSGIDLYQQMDDGGSRAGVWPQYTNFHDAAAAPLYAGEAHWDAAATAGVVEKNTAVGLSETLKTLPVFRKKPSAPWFNNYDDFKYDVKLQAKDYAIVPEFRLSENVEDYVKYGINNPSKTDTYEIPGTILTSVSSSFYKDYSNSEFLGEFLRVKSRNHLIGSQIRLVCSAAIKLNPYKGFYPAQRTIQLVTQFSKSYASGLQAWWEYSFPTPATGDYTRLQADGREILYNKGGAARPLMQALFAPGLMYNTIKSGMAVDYPTVLDSTRVWRAKYGGAATSSIRTYPNPSQADGPTFSENNYAIVPNPSTVTSSTFVATSLEGYSSGPYFDFRIPFETLITPTKYIDNVKFIDLEPHPSMSLMTTASMVVTDTDDLYELMAKNFFGEVPNFFLKDDNFTSLESDVVANDLKFPPNTVFGARLTLGRSMRGLKTYVFESGSTGNNLPFTQFGARAVNNGAFGPDAAWFPLPQDPAKGYLLEASSSTYDWTSTQQAYRETFTMYSRPTAFGPEISGRPMSASNGNLNSSPWLSASMSGTMDCFTGHNWAYTPPYYHGQAWCDFIFTPDPGKTYDVETILSEMKTKFWRVDPGPVLNTGMNSLIAGGPPPSDKILKGFPKTGSFNKEQPVYSGFNINSNAMQLSASFNLFGVQRVLKQKRDKFGNLTESGNETAGMKWVIQPKFETPMLNFNDKGIHPIVSSSSDSALTLPLYATASVPRGMWHQFGVVPPDSKKGIFLDIGDIPSQWLKYHYDVVSTGSIYNNFSPEATGSTLHKTMRSLSDLFGFQRKTSRKRLGELKEKKTIYEAVIAIPYVLEDIYTAPGISSTTMSDGILKTKKKFISIPKEKVDATHPSKIGSPTADSLTAAGLSIRKLMKKAQRYVLPPEVDFMNNKNIDPMVMYMFEFSYDLDKDDLSYIWQNVAPRNFRELKFQHSSTAHALGSTELLSDAILSENPNLRWMVFKVKQKAEDNYYNKVQDQAGASAGEAIFDDLKTKEGYNLGYNWPYDYVSIVEMIKMDVEIMLQSKSSRPGDTIAPSPADALASAISGLVSTTLATATTPTPMATPGMTGIPTATTGY